MAREEKIIIRVSEEMKTSFQSLAESMGMTMSGLGAYVIGNFMKEEKYRREMQSKLLEQISPQMFNAMEHINLDDPRLAKTISEAFSHIATQKPNNP